LDWDQQTYMPTGGTEARSEHVSILGRMAHEILTDEQTLRQLEAAEREAEEGSEGAAICRNVRRQFDQATKLPTALVAKKMRLSSLAHEKWVVARRNNDFKSFAGTLEEMFDIVREEAECLGYTNHLYDALIDQYEEGATHADCTAMFATLKGPMVELITRANRKSTTPSSMGSGTLPPSRHLPKCLSRQSAMTFPAAVKTLRSTRSARRFPSAMFA
jgi:carboxypeptidase Taq